MKTIFTSLLSLIAVFALSTKSYAQTPDIEVTSVYVYEVINNAIGNTITEACTEDTTAVGLTLQNNGPDLVTGDTIQMGWSENPSGFLIAVLTQDFTSGTTANFIVVQAQIAPATVQEWKVCIWPTYTSKGFTNSDSTVGNACGTVDVKDCGNPTGLNGYTMSVNSVFYHNGVLNVSLNSGESQTATLEVYSMNGQILHSEQIRKSSGEEMITIPLHNIGNGMHILRLTNQVGDVKVHKFMK